MQLLNSSSMPLLLLRGKLVFLRDFFKTKLPLLAAIIFLATSSLVAQNSIVAENAKPGTPELEWDIIGKGDLSIQGFATQISVNKGEKVTFKIKTDADNYSINIYRIGYYQGNGARKVGEGTVTAALPQTQPEDQYDLLTGKTDCSNWEASAEWNAPSDAVSGFYVARLKRADNGGASHILFVVRDDAGTSDLLYKTSDATWQAYNNYGGNSLYENNSGIPVLGFVHATKVSYDRPFYIRTGQGDNSDCFSPFNAEYPMIRWLERNGYDVSYTTDVDLSKNVTTITPAKHKALLSVGHDEYWSAGVRKTFEDARDAGVHLAFFSGNEVYWKVRWEDDYRTMVCYKEGAIGEYACGGKCDPMPNEWTGLWRFGCEFPGVDGCKPENALTGQISWIQVTGAITVPYEYKSLRFWRNTEIRGLAPGQYATLSSGTLGYEWDYEQFEAAYPAGRIALSNTGLGGRTHKLSLYRHSSGAWVFGAGTIQWSWGLDGSHDRGNTVEDPRMQQATVNLFGDMGLQPGSLQNNLVLATASDDNQPPVTTISTPTNGATLSKGSLVTISGTSTDLGSAIGGVEVSLDGGLTWNAANGTNNWTYNWKPDVLGVVNIWVRSFDDNGNMSIAENYSKISVSVGPEKCPCSTFDLVQLPTFPLVSDGKAIEVGYKFRANKDGYITGVRYYKGGGTTGVHLGHLWKSDGTMLSEATFINESSSGWQEISLPQPVAITANTTYIASVFSPSGDFALSNPYFETSIVNGPLTALGNGVDGPNGLYKYSNAPAFPTDNYLSSNYWVDVVFNTSDGFDIVTQPTSQVVCLGSAVSFNITTKGTPSPAIQWQVSTTGLVWTDVLGANSNTLSFTPPIADNGKLYRAVLTKDGISLNSSVVSLTVNQVIASVFQKTNASCTGGTLSITQSGGTAPYTYSLNGGTPQTSSTFSNLSAGTYTVTVRDAKGCSSTITGITITKVQDVVVYPYGKTDASCGANNGSFSLFAFWGSSPYQYSLDGVTYQTSNTFTNLNTGTYNARVKDANGCIVTASAVTLQSKTSTLALSLTSKKSSSCAGSDGSLTVSATGGAGSYTYSLNGVNYQSSNTFNNLASGTYSVRVKDAKGCIVSLNGVVISQSSTLALSLSSKANPSCANNDGSIKVTGSGGTSPYTYSINGGSFQTSNTFINLPAGTYQISVKDTKSCTTSISGISITQVTTLTSSVTSKTNVSCLLNDGSVTVAGAGGTAPYTYSINGGSFQSNSTFNNLAQGTYIVTVKDSKTCISVQSGIIISQVATTLTASVASKTNAGCLGTDGSITVAGAGGTGPYTYSINNGSFQSNSTFGNLVPGTYSVRVKDAKTCIATVTGVSINQAAALTLALSLKTNETCKGKDGSIMVTAGGGTSPYTYSLDGTNYQSSNTFSSVSAGTYSVKVKDAKSCVASISGVVITQGNAILATISSKTDAGCNDNNGTITVTATGGTAPYYYILSDGTYQSSGYFQGLDAGTYTVWVVDAKQCYTVVSGIVISEISTLKLAVSSKVDESCDEKDGSITVAATGGKSSYQYSINGGSYKSSSTFNGLSAGKYYVTVKDSKGCTFKLSGIDIDFVPFTASVNSKTVVSCNGKDGSISISASGGKSPYQFSVNGGNYFYDSDNTISNLSAGTYSVKVKDAKKCTSTISNIVLTQATKLTVAVSTKTNACSNLNNASITVAGTGGIEPYTYNINGGTYKSSGVFSGLTPGTYTLMVKDAKGCTSTVSGVTVSRTATPCSNRSSTITTNTTAPRDKTIKSTMEVLEVHVAPNPSNGNFNITLKGLNGSKVEIKILDAVGRAIVSRQVAVSSDNSVIPFNLKNVAKGMYFINVVSEKKSFSEKVVIQ